MAVRHPLALDAAAPGEAALFLAPAGLAERVGELPLPCRLLRVPPGTDLPRATSPGIARLDGPGGTVLAGPARVLREAVPPGLVDLLERLDAPSPAIRFSDGESWDFRGRTRIMGILNVTPDSFSDGGLWNDPARAIARAAEMLEEGAEILDVGGESTRPGAAPVDPEEETRRVVPVIRAIRREFPRARISVDTRRAAVAAAALEAGADLVNDVSALGDPGMAGVVARAGCPVILMHMRGTPDRMQDDTSYEDLLGEIAGHLAERRDRALAAGIAGDRILLDPGIGFGKSFAGNEEILRLLQGLTVLGAPLVLGVSRKRFLGARTGVSVPAERVPASLAAGVAAAFRGAAILRVHDVAATRQAIAIADVLAPRADGGARP